MLPKTPIYDSGYLIVHCDHGVIGSYTHWYPKIKEYVKKYSQWINSKCVTYGISVNSGNVGRIGHMTVNQLKELCDNGIEILNHNKHHVSIGKLTLAANANIGDTVIYVNSANYMGLSTLSSIGYIYSYELDNGEDKEVVYLSGYTSVSLTLSAPLTKAFPLGSTIQPTDETMGDLVEGGLSDLNGWGLNVTNYVYPDHSATHYDLNPYAVNYVDSLFDSSRGGYGETNDINAMNWSNLQGFAIRPSGEPAYDVIDRILDETADNNLIAIAWGHGETVAAVLDRLDYLIEGAFSRGIKIITQAKAYEMFA